MALEPLEQVGRLDVRVAIVGIAHLGAPAEQGIGLVEEGDRIRIDIPKRRIELLVADDVLAKRRAAMLERGSAAFTPSRKRFVSKALRAYGMMTTSAAKGAVRDLDQLVERRKQ